MSFWVPQMEKQQMQHLSLRSMNMNGTWVVLSGGAPTPAGTSMLTMWKICTHMKCEVKHNGDMGMGYFCLIMGGAFRVWLWLEWVGQLWQVSCCFIWKYAQKMLVLGEYPFRSSQRKLWQFHSQNYNSISYSVCLQGTEEWQETVKQACMCYLPYF